MQARHGWVLGCLWVLMILGLLAMTHYLCSLWRQVVMTAIAVANTFIWMPKRPGEHALLEVWLQEFSWTEDDIPRKRAERVSSLPEDSFENFCMDCEPMVRGCSARHMRQLSGLSA